MLACVGPMPGMLGEFHVGAGFMPGGRKAEGCAQLEPGERGLPLDAAFFAAIEIATGERVACCTLVGGMKPAARLRSTQKRRQLWSGLRGRVAWKATGTGQALGTVDCARRAPEANEQQQGVHCIS